MHQHATRTLLAAAALFAATTIAISTAQASVFTWKPNSVGLNGTIFTADSLILGDYAQITFGPDGKTFTDNGYMPIENFSLMGQILSPKRFNAKDHTGWGAYISYSAEGTQSWYGLGVPGSATFTRLDYEIIGYNGVATFSFGTEKEGAIVGGDRRGITLLGKGSLDNGGLTFEYELGSRPTIMGSARNTLSGVPTKLSKDEFIGLDVSIVHPPIDYESLPSGAIRIGGGTLSTATLRTGTDQVFAASLAAFALAPAATPADVPEPGTALLVGAGALGLALLRRQGR